MPTECSCVGPGCTPSAFVDIACLTEDQLANVDYDCPEPGMLATQRGGAGDPGCEAAVQAVKDACGPLRPGQSLELVTSKPEPNSAFLPSCASLQAGVQVFTCDPLGSPTGGTAPPLFTPEDVPGLTASLDPDPNGITWTSPQPKDPVADPVFPLSASDLDQNWNEVVDLLRLEIPGNTLRFMMQQAALRAAFDQLEALDYVECSGLACSIKLMSIPEVAENLEGMVYNKTEEVPANKGCLSGLANQVDCENEAHCIWNETHCSSEMISVHQGLNWKVKNVNDTIEISEISFAADDAIFSVTAFFDGKVILSTSSDLVIDFANQAQFGLVPLHDPHDVNGYPTTLEPIDKLASHLDSAFVLFNLPFTECDQLSKETIPYQGKEYALHDRYLTFASPFRCRCKSATEPSNNYCVMDSYPRARDVTAVFDLSGGVRHRVYCSAWDPDQQLPDTVVQEQLWADALPFTGAPPNHVTLELPLSSLASSFGMNANTRAQLITDVFEVGCAGNGVKRYSPEGDFPVVMNDREVMLGKRVSSAAGFQAAINLPMPAFQIDLVSGPIWMDLKLGYAAEQWFDDEWWTFPLGFITKLVLKVFSGLVSMTSPVATQLLDDTSTIQMGDVQLLAQGLLAHRTREIAWPQNTLIKEVTPEVAAGIRRVATNLPFIDVDLMDPLPEFSATSCDDLTSAANGWDWVASLFVCPFDVLLNIGKFVALPIVVLIKAVSEAVLDGVIQPNELLNTMFIENMTELQTNNDIAGLIASSVQSATLLPYYMSIDQTPGSAPSELALDLTGMTPADAASVLSAFLPPPFSGACLASPRAALDCFIAQVFAGGGELQSPQIDMVRMGAKTHLRSLSGPTLLISETDYARNGVSWDFPPVRFCVGGDTPPGQASYHSSFRRFATLEDYLQVPADGLLDQLSNFNEIEQSSEGHATPTDWRSQCAMFFDFKVTSTYTLRLPDPAAVFQLLVKPTRRTVFLINDVFTCPSDELCDLDPGVPNVPIRGRAELAACSMLADIWVSECDPPQNCPGTLPDGSWNYVNLLGGPLSNPVTADTMVALLTALAAGFGNTAATDLLQEAPDFFGRCGGLLEDAGFTIPANFPG